MPSGNPGEGSRESLTIGIRASGKGLTWNFVSARTWSGERQRVDIWAHLVRVGHLAWWRDRSPTVYHPNLLDSRGPYLRWRKDDGQWQDGQLLGRITRVSKAEAIGSAAEGKKATVRFNGSDEPLEQLPDVFLDSYLFWGRQKLDDEFKEALGEVGNEPLLWRMPAVHLGSWRRVHGIAIDRASHGMGGGHDAQRWHREQGSGRTADGFRPAGGLSETRIQPLFHASRLCSAPYTVLHSAM